jgi:hypothetical protein
MTNLKQFTKALEAMIPPDGGPLPFYYSVTAFNENMDALYGWPKRHGDNVFEIVVTVWDRSREDDVRYVDYWFTSEGTFMHTEIRSVKEDETSDAETVESAQ